MLEQLPDVVVITKQLRLCAVQFFAPPTPPRAGVGIGYPRAKIFSQIPHPRAMDFSQIPHPRALVFSRLTNFLLFLYMKLQNFRLRRALMYYF